jgi:hypothetical protein
MARGPYRIDHVILSTDQGRWREELHNILHRRGQEDWTLVALLNGGLGEVETPHQDSIAGPVDLTLIFRRQV